jgi:Beta-lactamase class C and other penicillin binding proteins
MRTRLAALALALLYGLLLAPVAQAQAPAPVLPAVKPEAVGLSGERLGQLSAALKNDIEKGLIPGATLLVARHGKIAWFEAMGTRDPASRAPMTKDAIFRIYSMSKPVTSLAVMMLVEDGKIALSDPVSKYIPQLGGLKVGVEKPGASGPTLELEPVRREMTIQDLLRHTSGLTYGIFGTGLVKKAYLDAKVWEDYPSNPEFVDRLAKLPLLHQPGATWEYSHSTDVLGRVIEVVSGRTLGEFFTVRILGPLGMRDTGFYVADPAKHARIVEPFANDRSIGLGAELNDPRVVQKWESGGGGLVSTTMDYARFTQMLLNGGSLNGKRLVSPKTVAYMTADHLGAGVASGPGPGYGFGLGFAVRKDAGMAPLPGTVGEYYWGGAAGTYFWIDPKEELVVVYMMQSPKQRVAARNLLRNMVYGALDKSAR